MKIFIRPVIFSYIALFVTQQIVGAFRFGQSLINTFFLVVLGFAILNFFMQPLLKLIGLPHKGPFYLILTFLMTLITFNALSILIPVFEITDTVVQELRIFGFVLPSKELNALWASVVSALAFTVTYNFFQWLSEGKR